MIDPRIEEYLLRLEQEELEVFRAVAPELNKEDFYAINVDGLACRLGMETVKPALHRLVQSGHLAQMAGEPGAHRNGYKLLRNFGYELDSI
ncbi:hypothetical protein [Glutamicibacter ardleyensis]|uniref:hypothetical protein n=1 Tax=Glutamicibacter ardleyensis TaxID=225894 RepID=UPI003F8FEB40